MKTRIFVSLCSLLFLLLTACNASISTNQSDIAAANPIESINLSSQSYLTQNWKEVETALATNLLPNAVMEKTFCEWQLLGENNSEYYLWVICEGKYPDSDLPTAVSLPLVITLSEDQIILDITLPEDGTRYTDSIQEMFPANIKDLILNNQIDTEGMLENLARRVDNPDVPPLSVSNESVEE